MTYKEQPNQYTVESAQKQLIEAHVKWSALPEPKDAFNGTWLTNNGYKGVYEWSNRRGGGLVEIVEQVGGDIARDFSYRENPRQYTLESAQAKLKDAHAQWLSSTEPRAAFNGNWLRQNGYEGLRGWADRHGGLSKLVAATGDDIAQDFEYLAAYTHESAQAKLEEAHAQWLETPEPKGAFNTGWLQGNGYSGLESRARRNGGLRRLAVQIGGAVAADLEYREQTADYTVESVLEKLSQAHAEWVSTPQPRVLFNGVWLQRNGYSRIYEWGRKQDGGLIGLSKQAGGDVARDFEHRERTKSRTQASAQDELREAHTQWLAAVEPRGIFNSTWLQRNGHNGLYQWTLKNQGLSELVRQTGGEVAEDFEFAGKDEYTDASAQEKLKQAHAQWLTIPEPRKKFSGRWLRDNGYSGLERWARRIARGLAQLVQKTGGAVATDFEFERTDISAQEELRQAHAQWLASPEPRSKFNGSWLLNNGYSPLYTWTVRNGGVRRLVEQTGGDAAADFDYQERIESRTDASAQIELREAHTKWLSSPEPRGKFNVKWLYNNGYRGLDKWIREHGGIGEIVKQIGGAVAADFEFREQYTDASAQEKLRQAHAEWLATPEPRGKFNWKWLQKHHYNGLIGWAAANGGLRELAERIGGAVARDLELRSSRKKFLSGELSEDDVVPWIDLAQADGLVEVSPDPYEEVSTGGASADSRAIDFSTFDVFTSDRGFRTVIDEAQVLEAESADSIESGSTERTIDQLSQGMEPTGAQRLRLLIGRNGDKWQRPEEARLYVEYIGQLPSYVVHRARISYLQQFFASRNFPFPSSIADLAAGPSIGYQAYQEVFGKNGLEPPTVVDIDGSQAMLDAGLNPQRLFANIAKQLPMDDGSFAMVESSYAIHHFTPTDVLQTLKEAHRVTELGGYINLASPVRFSQSFFNGLEQLGYEVLTQYGQRLALTEGAERAIADQYGFHVVDRMKDKLRSSFILLARKERTAVQIPSAELFTFERAPVAGGSGHREPYTESPAISSEMVRAQLTQLIGQMSEVLDHLRNFTARGVAHYRLPTSPFEQWDYKYTLKATVQQFRAAFRTLERSASLSLAGQVGIARRLLLDLEDARHMSRDEWHEYQSARRRLGQ